MSVTGRVLLVMGDICVPSAMEIGIGVGSATVGILRLETVLGWIRASVVHPQSTKAIIENFRVRSDFSSPESKN